MSDNQANTVIKFPKRPNVTADIVERNQKAFVAQQTNAAVLEITDTMIASIFIVLAERGYDIDEINQKDLALVVEAIKSMISGTFGIDHKLQDYADKFIELV